MERAKRTSLIVDFDYSSPKLYTESYVLELKTKLKKQKEVIDKIKKLIKQYGKYDGQKCTRGFQMWTADFNKLLEILEDKEASE